MIFRNSSGRLEFRKKSLLMALGVVAIPLTLQLHSAATPLAVKIPKAPHDPRVARLHGFLKKLDCPVAPLAEDFVKAADENQLDWRLLPSIAVIESGGGKAYKNNNIFGWNKGEQAFATIRSGLELVAYKLGRSPLYRRHDSLGKLRIYNEHQDYPAVVMAVMNRISPNVTLRAVSDSMAYPRDILEAEMVQY